MLQSRIERWPMSGFALDGVVGFAELTWNLDAGAMTFVTPDGEVTASAGDLMTVPPGAIHTFRNASETEDCECYMTATPGEKGLPNVSLPGLACSLTASMTVGHYVDCEY